MVIVSLMIVPLIILSTFYAVFIGLQWHGDKWTLFSSPIDLSYQGKENWKTALDAISRVEISRTSEFTPARRYAGTPHGIDPIQSVPRDEWQTFLFLKDGTRRVVYHANAARDDCAALAASIREYVEQARHAAPAASPSSPWPSAPVADGFDL